MNEFDEKKSLFDPKKSARGFTSIGISKAKSEWKGEDGEYIKVKILTEHYLPAIKGVPTDVGIDHILDTYNNRTGRVIMERVLIDFHMKEARQYSWDEIRHLYAVLRGEVSSEPLPTEGTGNTTITVTPKEVQS